MGKDVACQIWLQRGRPTRGCQPEAPSSPTEPQDQKLAAYLYVYYELWI